MSQESPLLEVTRQDGVVHLVGEIDYSNASDFEQEVGREVGQGRHVVLECSGLSFIDSTGLGALAEISRILGDEGTLELRNATPSVARAAKVLGLDRLPNFQLTS